MVERIIAILLNPDAGKGRAANYCRRIENKCQELGIAYKAFHGCWPELLDGFTDIFVVGGDGTLNYFINKYPAIKLPITLFKGGSGNDFAWKLYGEISFEECWNVGWNGHLVYIDAGICNNRYFINGVGIGFDGEVVKTMGSKRIVSAGHFAYLFTVLHKILFYRENEMHVQAVGFNHSGKIFMISIANGSRYGGGFMVAPHANITDGLFDIVIVKELQLFSRLRYLPAIEKGKHLHLPFMLSSRSNEVSILCNKIVSAHLDGELMQSGKYEIKLLPAHFCFRQRNP